MKTKNFVVFFVMVIFINGGCLTYKGLKPVSPKPKTNHPFLNPTPVDSLKPTFTWKKSKESGVAYDFAIWDTVSSSLNNRTIYTKLKEIYHREGLTQPTHSMEKPLKPDHVYMWTVRTRKGDIAGKWSVYDWAYTDWDANDQFFMFKTPSK
ncbi:hypothetical protein JW979_06790 [bacterium]|nr:hypothetical protein [candidate division CSSED10-310 bacterium]